VRWQRLYRSGVLAYLTPADLASLDARGIRVVCDFRNTRERQREGIRWARDGLEILSWDYDPTLVSLRGALGSDKLTPVTGRAAMLRLYRARPEHLATAYAGLFARLAAGDLPLVFACAAGKDRTGVAIAVLLRALGVSRTAVIEDYLLTNEVGDFEQFIRTRHAAQLGLADAQHPLLAMPEDVRRVLFSADAAFLDAALAEIDASPGGLEGYLERSAGVAPAVLERVRHALLA